MSTELQKPEGVEAAHTALDEFRAAEDECGEFFGGVFDQLQSLSLELFARHKCQQLSAEHKASADGTLATFREEFRRAAEELQHTSTKIESQLTRLTAAANEIVQSREGGTAENHAAAIQEAIRWQQADWLQQRAALEAEIETLRSRAEEQTEALHEQKRLAARHQAELTGELKRMRSLLDALAAQIRGDPIVSGDGERPPPLDALMVSSVLAQVQLMQREAAACGGRRNADIESAAIISDATAK